MLSEQISKWIFYYSKLLLYFHSECCLELYTKRFIEMKKLQNGYISILNCLNWYTYILDAFLERKKTENSMSW